jgi:Thaumatin family
MRTISRYTSILVLLTCGIPAISGLGIAAQVSCPANQRELLITNNTSQDIWIGGGGAALRSVCVVDQNTSCLAVSASINPSTGACRCGTQSGTLACPGTAQSTGSGTNGGLNCACTVDSDCGSGAGCNTTANVCYFLLPTAPVAHAYIRKPFTWQLAKASPSQQGGWAEFCLDQASVMWNGSSIPSAVWWNGGVFARTGCMSNGTGCATADCNAAPDSNCGAGVGASNPATIAEVTLQSKQNDFYDITAINGANVAAKILPLPAAKATPGGVSAPYWCKVPGATVAQGGKCDWNFGRYTKWVHYPKDSVTDYTSFLLNSSKPCSTNAKPTGCPSGYTCSGAQGGCFLTCNPGGSPCPDSLECLPSQDPSQDSNNYCQCSKQSECSGKGYCGTQFIPGKGTFLQQCGKFAGWWSADDFCGSFPNDTVGPLNCGEMIKDGDYSSQTNRASLFACAAKGTNGLSPGNGTSCYNQTTAATYPFTCCGCGTYDQDDADSLSRFWPKNGTTSCAKVDVHKANDKVWETDIQPWLVNLKRACPTAYSYPYDDPTSTFQCRGKGTTNLLGYHIIFMNLPKPPQ